MDTSTPNPKDFEENNPKKVSPHQPEALKDEQERVSAILKGLILHFDFTSTPPSKLAYKDAFDAKREVDPTKFDSRFEFWYNLLAINGIRSFQNGFMTKPFAAYFKPEIDSYSLDKLTKNIEWNFPRILKKIIIEKFGYAHSFFSFQIKAFEYGSLDLLLEITNTKNLAEKFDGSIDFFIGFLEMYAPLALIESTGYSEYLQNPAQLKAKVEKPTEEFKDQFTSKTENPQNPAQLNATVTVVKSSVEGKAQPTNQTSSKSISNKLNTFFTLAKISWVIPTVLTLVILYYLYQDTKETKLLYHNNYNSLLKQQQELLKLQYEYIKTELQNQKQNNELKTSIDTTKKESKP